MKIKYSFKYGQTGLFLRVFYGKGYVNKSDIHLSSDYPKIYKFFDLDYTKWEEGFNELEDIFEFVYESQYFDGSIFQMDQLNKINRDRNAKRTSYTSFLEWIDQQPQKTYDFNNNEVSITDINETFPEANLIENIRRLEYEHCRKLYIQSKFTGGEIMRRYGITGKDLGESIVNFKLFISKAYGNFWESFDEFILETDKEEIFTLFERCVKSKNC